MSEGQMFARGPQGQVPNGMAVNGQTGPDIYGNIPLNGGSGEHVTVFGDGWHRSWDNPGPTGDHSTIHGSGQIRQNGK